MPRKAPDKVVEHRISLSNYEREEFKQALEAYRFDKKAENIPNLMIAGSAVGYVAVTGVIAVGLYRFLTSDKLSDTINETVGAATLFGLNALSIIDQPFGSNQAAADLFNEDIGDSKPIGNAAQCDANYIPKIKALQAKIAANEARLNSGFPNVILNLYVQKLKRDLALEVAAYNKCRYKAGNPIRPGSEFAADRVLR